MDDDAPQKTQEGYNAPKRVKKQIHLTLPTSPKHVTTTESFTAFFINHGLTKALCKAFKRKGWTTDQMQELITNFQQKHRKRVPLPKIYMDEDSSDSEGIKLQDGTRAGQKAGGSGGSGGNKHRRDDDDNSDGPSKRRKTSHKPKPPRRPIAKRELRKTGPQYQGPALKYRVAYPPIDRKLPPLYISCPKERTQLGFCTLDWTDTQIDKVHRARLQG